MFNFGRISPMHSQYGRIHISTYTVRQSVGEGNYTRSITYFRVNLEIETSLEINFTMRKKGRFFKGKNELPDFDKDLNIRTADPEQTYKILSARREDILSIKSKLMEPVKINGNGSELIIGVSRLGFGQLRLMIHLMEVFAEILKD